MVILCVAAAVATTAEAAAAAVIAPTVPLLVPLPKGKRSRRSGTLKVVEPSPVPKAVLIIAKSTE